MFETVQEYLSIIIDYVNSNGGWSIVGWFRIQMLQDVSDVSQDLPRNQIEWIAVETFTPYVSRLCPSDIEASQLYQFQLHRRKVDWSTNVVNAPNHLPAIDVNVSTILFCTIFAKHNTCPLPCEVYDRSTLLQHISISISQ